MDFESLHDLLSSAMGSVHVRVSGEDRAIFAVPDPRRTHDELIISVERTVGGWIATDLGVTSFLLGDEFDAVAEAMICGGAAFAQDQAQLRVVLPGDTEERVAAELSKFAANVAAAPLVGRAIACASPKREQSVSSTIQLALETRSSILQSVPLAAAFLTVDDPVHGAMEPVKAPLQFRSTSGSVPRLLAACIDYSAGAQAETSGKRLTSFLWDATRELESTQRYVIVRGSSEQVGRVAHLYDAKEVTALAADDLASLSESVAELMG